MPIPFTCPHCGVQATVADEYAGQSGPCSRCGKTIAVPGAVGTEAAPASRPASSVTSLLHVITAGGVFLVLMTLLLLPAVNSSHTPTSRDRCRPNLRSIALAMHTYHNLHKRFPPAYIADEDGKPMHSWRVLLLPFLEGEALYDEYDLDEPWDGPNNIRLADRMSSIYHCPGETSDQSKRETSYVMVVGPGTLSDGPTATTIPEITDGTSQTIMIVEVANSGILWTEPRDLDAKELAAGINAPGGRGIRSPHPGGINVAFCDGHVKWVADSIPPEMLQALSTIAGGEDVGDSRKW